MAKLRKETRRLFNRVNVTVKRNSWMEYCEAVDARPTCAKFKKALTKIYQNKMGTILKKDSTYSKNETKSLCYYKEQTTKPSNSTSPLDGIYPIMLQQGIEEVRKLLCDLFRVSLALKHIPEWWLTIKTIFLPKPGKENYV